MNFQGIIQSVLQHNGFVFGEVVIECIVGSFEYRGDTHTISCIFMNIEELNRFIEVLKQSFKSLYINSNESHTHKRKINQYYECSCYNDNDACFLEFFILKNIKKNILDCIQSFVKDVASLDIDEVVLTPTSILCPFGIIQTAKNRIFKSISYPCPYALFRSKRLINSGWNMINNPKNIKKEWHICTISDFTCLNCKTCSLPFLLEDMIVIWGRECEAHHFSCAISNMDIHHQDGDGVEVNE